MNLVLDIGALLLSAGCLVGSVWIYRLVGGQGRILTSLAFVWATVLRFAIVAKDLGWLSWPTAQLSSFFYVPMFIGIVMLIVEIKSITRK